MAKVATAVKNRVKEQLGDNGRGKAKDIPTQVSVPPPNMQKVQFTIKGTAPLVVNRFGNKAKQQMIETQIAGSTAKSKKKREPKNFEALFHDARHVSEEGWDGVHAACFRNGCISACRTVGFTMTRAKLALFVDQDGLDQQDGTPLVRIIGPEPEMWIAEARNSSGGMDLRARPMWRKWQMVVRMTYDADIFTMGDVANLMKRVGLQVGICEGRPDSKASAGLGFGTFELIGGE